MSYPFKLFGQIILLFSLTLLLQNCAENDLTDAPATKTAESAALIDLDKATEVEYLEQSGVESRAASFFTFNTLNQALACTGLDAVVANGTFTVYAPSDAAFAKLGLNAHNICDAIDNETLTNILLYHVIPSEIASISREGCAQMANGDLTQLSERFHQNFINESKIYLSITIGVHPNILRLYAITDVLEVPASNIVETAASASIFESLVAAVLAADPAIAAALSDNDAIYTVFAPTNEAFANLVAGLGANSLEELVAAVGVEALSTILLYHVVDACAFSNDLKNGQTLRTLQGENLFVDLDNLAIIDKTTEASNLEVELLDIRTANGVVHGINKVLLPNAILENL